MPTPLVGRARRGATLPPVAPGEEAVDPAGMREAYDRGGLDEADLAADPVTQFRSWFAAARAYGLPEPNAMVLATASSAGRPSARTVLLKGVDERGFAFYTSYSSRKASELDANPVASLVFPWFAMQRQVVVCGAAERVERAESEAYWNSRPYESRLGAWASPQSRVVESREWLERRWTEARGRFPEQAQVPLPETWGGYRVVPDTVEFWHGRVGRLHDRLRYRRGEGPTGRWVVERLGP